MNYVLSFRQSALYKHIILYLLHIFDLNHVVRMCPQKNLVSMKMLR